MAFIPTQYNNPIFVYSLRKLVADYFDPLVRVIRESDHVEVDVLPDSNNEISYDSIIIGSRDTAATTLGEFLNIDGYTDVDSLGSVYEGRLSRVYDQSAGEFDIDIAAYGDAFLFVETNLAEYNGSTAIHKVNGIPTFRPQQLTTAFQVSNVREREVSYHFLVEGTQSGFFGVIDSSNTLAIQGIHNSDVERTYTSFVSPSTPSDWDVNDVYFDSVVSTNITGSLYESNTWSGFDTAIITVEVAIKDNAVTQSAFPDNIATFRLVQDNWYCDLIAFDDYDPIRRLIIEGLYADASSNAPALARTSKLLVNVEDPTQSGFLAQYPNAAAAYSVRSLTGYSGAPSEANPSPKILRVRRSIDNVEVDVYPQADGWFGLDSEIEEVVELGGVEEGDSDAFLFRDFARGSDVTVCVWYNQANDFDPDWVTATNTQKNATQEQTGSQPKIYDSSTGVVLENGKPAIEFDGINYGLNCSTNLRTVGGASSVFATYKIPTRNVLQNPIAFHKVQRWLSNKSNLSYQNLAISTADTADEYIKYLSLSTTNQQIYTAIWDGITQRSSVDDVVLYANGVIESPTAVPSGFGVPASGTNSLGFRNDTTSQFCLGNMQEVVIYLSDQEAAGNRSDIESNINNAYSIYSAAFPSVLDKVPNAAAAYSVRRLTKEYKGPLITVAGKDFYPDFWGNLNAQAVVDHATAEGNYNITKWWDQSGKGNHLESAANHPTLNISNSVVTGVTVNSTNGFDTAQIITDMNAVTTGSKQLIAVTSTIDDTIDLNTTSYTDLKEIIYYT